VYFQEEIHLLNIRNCGQGYFGARGPGFGLQSFAFNSTSANMYKYELRLWQLRLFVVVKQCFMANVLLHGNNSDVIWVEGYPSMLSKTTMCFKILLRITSVTTILGTFNISILFANVNKAVESTSGLVHSTQNLC
jgi:hypothetical protein